MVVFGIQRGLSGELFPVDLIYRPWKHAEGQVKVRACYISALKLHIFKSVSSREKGVCGLDLSNSTTV